jgi:sugar phosphate isomerase/epimerase
VSGRPSRRAILGAALLGSQLPVTAAQPPLKLAIFSKHLHWAGWDEMAAFAAEAGFDGIDLTVRPGGHVAPERAAADLPRAAAAIRKAGLDLPMITTAIVDAATPHAAAVLRAAASLGVRRYRWGGMLYNDTAPIPAQLDALRRRAAGLADLNRSLGVTAMYHTHSGMEVGAPIWDLYLLLKEFDPAELAVNYDIGHAVVEGGFGGWVRSAQLVRPWMRGVALKDFRWAADANGKWLPEWRPPGEGMVDFPRFFRMLRQQAFAGPVQVHFEYKGLGGAEDGAAAIAIPRTALIAACRRDVAFYRRLMREAGI